jgi:hypothetical protein
MNKELLKEFQLQAGGSHYPNINPQMQEAFARMIINKCIEAVKQTNRTHAYTTYDMDIAEATIQRSIDSITKTFGLPDELYSAQKSSKITQTI